MSVLPPVFIEFVGTLGGLKTASKGVKAELTAVEKEGGGSMAKLGVLSKAALLGVGAGVVALGAETLHMAGDFQQGMTRLVTGAGESQSNLKMVSDGILAMAGQVGQSTKDLSSGMYLVESAGYHGADALKVLKFAAEGAKVGNADLATVADAVTTGLNAYHLSADKAAQVTNALVAAEGQGKTNLEALAGSLATVAPIASTAHVSLNEVLGAMSTMTAEGTPAADAATYLKQTIAQLSNPSGKAAMEMKSLGLNSVTVSQNLGKNGLASTLEMLTNAIQSKMGPAGTVLIEHLQKAAKSSTDFQKVLANLPPAQQTYVGALADMVGGTKSMQAALELTGDNMKVFKDNTQVINEKVKTGGQNIEGWSLVQKNFNQKIAEAKGGIEAMGIKIGTALLPVASKMLGWVMDSAKWLGKHKDVLYALASVVGGALVVGLGAATVAAWSFTVALLANPITWIVLAIAALIFGLIELATHWKTVWGFLKKVGEDIGKWFAGPFVDFFKDAWNWVVKHLEEAVHWIHVKWDEAVDYVRGIPEKIRQFFSHLGDDFKEIGKNIVMGIVHGIENSASAVGDAVKNMAKDALHSVTSFLGISSPSRVFADEVGRWIPHGIAAGITEHGGVATDAVSALSGRLGGISPLGGAAFAGAGGGGVSYIENNINIDGQRFVTVITPYVQRANGRNSANWFSIGGR